MLQELNRNQVNLNANGFWADRLKINAGRAIFHQYEMLEASGCIDNFRILVGDKVGFREGWFFADSDAYKWLDAAARITPPDPRLGALMDTFIDLIARAQTADGYIFTYNQIHFPGQRWVNLQIEHELYCLGHLIEAAVSHYKATQKTSLLNVALRAADLLVRDFKVGGAERTCGHEEIEIALLKLHLVTGNRAYLDLARSFIERRGSSLLFPLHILRQNLSMEKRRKFVQGLRSAYAAKNPDYASSKVPPGNYAKMPANGEKIRILNALSGRYFQQHAPIRRQTTPEGHSVRFGYFETAAAMLNRIQPDPELLAAMEQAWERMVTRRMYITGGVGSQPSTEGFGADYDLDPELAYNETCAALAIQFWSWELALTTGKACYSDLFEWQLYNASAVGMGMNGETYLYNNPLTVRGGISRRPWYAVPCCPSNLSRTYAELDRYLYSMDPSGFWIHQYISSQVNLDLAEKTTIQLDSGLPWSGKVHIKINPAQPVNFTLHLRIPSWAGTEPVFLLRQAGQAESIRLQTNILPGPAAEATAQGFDPRQSCFTHLNRTWTAGDLLEIDFGMDIHAHKALLQVGGHAEKIAISRGPQVYCLESLDNPEVDIFTTELDLYSLESEYRPDLLGGIHVLTARSQEDQQLIFIPYHLWGNRGESKMVVWLNG